MVEIFLEFLRDLLSPEKPNIIDYLKILLEFLRLFFSTPVLVVGLIYVLINKFREEVKSLLLRVTALKLPGGGEISASQADRLVLENRNSESLNSSSPEIKYPENLSLNSDQQKSLIQFIDAERAKAYIWEYRFLNLYLVIGSQCVLDWIAGKKTTSLGFFDATWLPIITDPKERNAILAALHNHHLIEINGDAINITPKGQEYLEFRGSLPPVNEK